MAGPARGFHLDLTPTRSSWLNMVERFLRAVTEKRLRRGIFESVPELVTALEKYLGHYNENPTLFSLDGKAIDILKSRAARKDFREVEVTLIEAGYPSDCHSGNTSSTFVDS